MLLKAKFERCFKQQTGRLFGAEVQVDMCRAETEFIVSDCTEKEQTVYKNPRRSGTHFSKNLQNKLP